MRVMRQNHFAVQGWQIGPSMRSPIRSYAGRAPPPKRTCARMPPNCGSYWRLELHRPAMSMIKGGRRPCV
jgi:hypothetical protein